MKINDDFDSKLYERFEWALLLYGTDKEKEMVREMIPDNWDDYMKAKKIIFEKFSYIMKRLD